MIVAYNKHYGFLAGHGVTMKPCIGVHARYTLRLNEAKQFESEDELNALVKQCGWKVEFEVRQV